MLIPTLRHSISRTSPRVSRERLMSSSARLSRSPVSLVTPSQLSDLLERDRQEGKVVPLDASWFMPNLEPKRYGYEEFRTKRIKGAAFWDVDQIASTSDVGVPHNIPSTSQFEDAASRLGISRDSHVVVYDSTGVFSSPRTAFTFSHFNHPLISVLDGGLPRWEAEQHPIDTKIPSNPNPHDVEANEGARPKFGPILSELLYAKKPKVESYFIADIEENFTDYKVDGAEKEDVKQWDDMDANIDKGDQGEVVLDARPTGRFNGTDPEPRPGLSSGHMPHSLSLPSTAVLSSESSTTPKYKTLLPTYELEGVFEKAMGKETWELVKKGEKAVTTTCGSGMTAAILWLALQKCGVEAPVSIYDESWTGYASREKSKIVKN
ncbi:hypothetical protein JCM10212_004894 [Sporobolomyces blumeae]